MRGIHLVLLILIVLCSGKPRATDNTSGASALSDKEVVCFIYHRFADSRYPSTNISLHDFEEHLDYLAKNNFQVLSFSAAMDYLQSDEPVRKTAVITIDDGYKSFF